MKFICCVVLKDEYSEPDFKVTLKEFLKDFSFETLILPGYLRFSIPVNLMLIDFSLFCLNLMMGGLLKTD